jgi:hypothetical protein
LGASLDRLLRELLRIGQHPELRPSQRSHSGILGPSAAFQRCVGPRDWTRRECRRLLGAPRRVPVYGAIPLCRRGRFARTIPPNPHSDSPRCDLRGRRAAFAWPSRLCPVSVRRRVAGPVWRLSQSQLSILGTDHASELGDRARRSPRRAPARRSGTAIRASTRGSTIELTPLDHRRRPRGREPQA